MICELFRILQGVKTVKPMNQSAAFLFILLSTSAPLGVAWASNLDTNHRATTGTAVGNRTDVEQPQSFAWGSRAPDPTGCDTLDPTPIDRSVEFQTVIQAIFTGGPSQVAKCTECHSPNTSAGLSLAPENSFTLLFNVDSSQDATIKRVAPFSSGNSLLFRKVNCGNPGVGLRMPRNRPALSLDEQRLIRDWIDQGALLRQRVLVNGFE